jgi:uncharacterized membrane protein
MQVALYAVIVGVIMGAIDSVWLSIVANKFYKSQIGQLLLERPNMAAAVLFYVIYVIGVVAFVLLPALEKNSWQHALGYGALFGLVAYATYDLTNLATLKDWPVKLVVVDLIWGAVLTAAVAALAYGVIKTWLS